MSKRAIVYSNINLVIAFEEYLFIEAKAGLRTMLEVLEGTINLANAIEESGKDRVLLDYRSVQFPSATPDVFNLTRFYRKWSVFSKIKSASIINKETLEVAKVWEEFCVKQGFNFRYFLDPEEAKNWLLRD